VKILLVEDDLLVAQTLQMVLRDNFELRHVPSAAAAQAAVEREEFDGAVLDIHLGEGTETGVDLLKTLKKRFPDLPVVMSSGHKTAALIVQCIQEGANDFIEKPIDATTLGIRLRKAFQDSRRHGVLRRAFERSSAAATLVGSNPAFDAARKLVARAGRMRILFHGETGVGKTPFAQYSNQVLSQEEGQLRPFEQVNCAGLSKEQFQDTLFGHKKGAFTGAIADKAGLVAIAKGGDLFLDEVGEMPLDTQALFLTFIDTQEYYRLGDDQKRKADVRILCATNRDLKKMVAEGTFRKDLYSRLSQVVVAIPPLRERRDDIPALVDHFVRIYAGRNKPVAEEARRRLYEHDWVEGNVRELRDAVEYLCTMGRNADVLAVEHLPDHVAPRLPTSALPAAGPATMAPWMELVEAHGLECSLNAVEKSILEHYVLRHGGVTDDLVRVLKTSKPTLYRRLRQYGIAADPQGRPH
jgi:DNA-binding NtrC family response regulator